MNKTFVFKDLLENHRDNHFEDDNASIIDILDAFELITTTFRQSEIYIPLFDTKVEAVSVLDLPITFRITCEKLLKEYIYDKVVNVNVKSFVFLYLGNVYTCHCVFRYDLKIYCCIDSHLL